MGYEQNVLIQLKRQYGKDEYVAKLLKIISETELELGKTISERDEALFERKSVEKKYNKLLGSFEQNKKIVEDISNKIRRENMYRKILNKNSKLGNQLSKLREQRDYAFYELNKIRNN